MDIRKIIAIGFILLAALMIAQPADALLWPPVIGSCGLGGIFGPFGPLGPLYGYIPVPYPVPVPVPAPGPFCGPIDYGLAGPCGIGPGYPC